MAAAASADGGLGKDELSPADLSAWVDSCLAMSKEEGDERSASDDAWASMTQAFVSALASFSETAPAVPDDDHRTIQDRTSVDSQGSSGIDVSGGELISNIAAAASNYAGALSDRQFQGIGGTRAGISAGGRPSNAAAALLEDVEGESEARLSAEAVVIGKEFPEGQVYDDGGDEFTIAILSDEQAAEDLSKDLFKVWDLRNAGAAAEEEDADELSTLLKKMLEQSSVGGVPPAVDADGWESDDARQGTDDPATERMEAPEAAPDSPNLKSLVAAISDLSLLPSPGQPGGD